MPGSVRIVSGWTGVNPEGGQRCFQLRWPTEGSDLQKGQCEHQEQK